MKLPRRVTLLKILAATAVNAFVYAITFTLRTALFETDGGLTAFLLYVLTALLGNLAGVILLGGTPSFVKKFESSKLAGFISFMLNIKKNAHLAASMTAWGIILLPLLSSFMIFRQYGIWRTLFEILTAMTAYIISLKHSKLSPAGIMSKTVSYAGFISLMACLVVPNFTTGLIHLKPKLYAILYYFILAYLIVRNQEDIDSNIFDKKHVEKSILPRNLRRFNILLVCIIFVLIIFFFNFKRLVTYILKFLGRLTFLVIEVVFWILNLLLPADENAVQGGIPAQKPDFIGDVTETIYPFRDFLFNIIKNFVIIYLAYRIILYLSGKLPGLLRRVIERIRRILAIKSETESFEATDYSDETETLKPVRKHSTQRQLKRGMKKNRRDLRNISDPVEKIRYMYYSVLCMLPLLGVYPDKSDTTMEIIRNISPGNVSKEFSHFTAIYNQVRYGEKVPDTVMLEDAERHFCRTVEAIDSK